jgi:hypothetical protein
MTEHHERAITAFLDAARARGALGVIIVGSVARGTERPDSDVDLYEVVDDAAFDDALASGALARVETEHADWPGGYLDIKLVSPTLLRRAVDDADDATRASFTGARIEFDRDGGLEGILAAIVTPGAEYFHRHIAAFGAQFALHADYFLVHGREHDDPLLAASAAVHAAFAAGRMALAAERVLFRGPKYLDAQLRGAGRATLADAATALVDERSHAAVERVRALVPELTARAGQIDDADLARFIADNEWAWFTARTPPEYR